MSPCPIDLWKFQARQWAHVGRPLRPGPHDIAVTREAISQWLRTTCRKCPSTLTMGVTPELGGLAMNGESHVIGVDKSAEMIATVWPGRSRAGCDAICADWRRMPLASSSIDLVLGDGSLSSVAYPADYSVLLSELRRVLRPDGRCIIRCFEQRENKETPQDVLADLARGRIGSFHALKLRLAMAIQPDAEAGVAVENVWSVLHEAWPDLELLAKRFDWPIAEVLTIQVYRDISVRYTFPTHAQYCESFSRARFSVIQVATGSYEMGERCPTFVLELLPGELSGS